MIDIAEVFRSRVIAEAEQESLEIRNVIIDSPTTVTIGKPVYVGNWIHIRPWVEIGNDEVYGDCTHREVQIPTAWSASGITINVQKGSIGNLSDNFLFVVDPDGTPSAGFALSGVSESTTNGVQISNVNFNNVTIKKTGG